VWNQIKTRKIIINSAKDFYDSARELKKTIILIVYANEINDVKPSLDKIWETGKAIPEISSSHHFKYLDRKTIEIRKTWRSQKSRIFDCFQ